MYKFVVAARALTEYYHYSDRKFEVGDIITGNDYSSKIADDIITAYTEYTKMDKICAVLYMLNSMSEEYKYSYKYEYNVSPLSKVLKCQMDYSIILCSSELARCCMYFLNNNPEETIENCRAVYIYLMASAYVGDNTSKTMLKQYYNISNKIEYICQEAEVKTVI